MLDVNNVPCKICGSEHGWAGTGLCDSCWEVTHRLEDFLKRPAALDHIRNALPVLDDWADKVPDAWDYDKVLCDNDVSVTWCDEITSDGVTYTPAPPDLCGWCFGWKYGSIYIGHTTEIIARKAAALFVELWRRHVSASFCNKLMDGYIIWLERQENAAVAFRVDIVDGKMQYAYMDCENEPYPRVERRLIPVLTPVGPDEIIVATFTKRKIH
jgi:hypothetical protein